MCQKPSEINITYLKCLKEIKPLGRGGGLHKKWPWLTLNTFCHSLFYKNEVLINKLQESFYKAFKNFKWTTFSNHSSWFPLAISYLLTCTNLVGNVSKVEMTILYRWPNGYKTSLQSQIDLWGDIFGVILCTPLRNL